MTWVKSVSGISAQQMPRTTGSVTRHEGYFDAREDELFTASGRRINSELTIGMLTMMALTTSFFVTVERLVVN
jgi:hypothetical protein